MVAQPVTAEVVVPRAIAIEAVPITGLTAVDIMAQDVLKKANEAPDGWRKALEASRQTPITEIDKTIKQIGLERNPTTGQKRRNQEEQKRYNRAEKATGLGKKFLEQGYDVMSSTEQKKLRDMVLARARLTPALAAEIDAMVALGQSQEVKFAERILKDPRYAGFAREIFQKNLNAEPLADAVTSASEKYKEADIRKKEKEDESKDLSLEIAVVETQLVDFNRTVNLGPKAIEIDNLRKEVSQLQSEVTRYEGDLKLAEETLTRRKDDREYDARRQVGDLTSHNLAIDAAQKEVNKCQKELAERRSKIKRLEQLEKDEERLRNSKKELAEKRRKLDVERGQIDLEWQRRRMELEDAGTLRASQEEDLVRGFEDVFNNAVDGWVNTEVERLSTTFEQEITEKKEKAKDQREKPLYDALQKRWVKEKKIGKETRRGIDKRQVDEDYNTLMDRGPYSIMYDMLNGSINPETNNLYVPAEINALLADKEYVAKMQPEVVKQLLSRQIITEGIRQEDIFIIVNSHWGQGMIEQALASNKEFRDAVEGVFGAGAVKKRGFFEKFGQQVKEHPWWWLWLLAGIIGAPIAFGIAAAQMPHEEEKLKMF